MARSLRVQDTGEPEVRGAVGPPFQKLVGGALCVDFVNTVGAWVDGAEGESGIAEERLPDYDSLLEWSRTVGALDEETVGSLHAEGLRRPGQAAAVSERARMLRRALYEVLRACAEDRAPDAARLDRLNDELGVLRRNERVEVDGRRLALRWVGASSDLDAPLWPVVRSALRLLTTPALLERVARCAGERCGWLFLDTSRGRRRRWCDMADCGNVAKVRAHRARKRRSRTPKRPEKRKA